MKFSIGNGRDLASFFESRWFAPPKITFGCDMKYLNDNWHHLSSFFRKFVGVEEYYEKNIESLITHEYFHYVIHREVGNYASDRFNNIDRTHEITFVNCDENNL